MNTNTHVHTGTWPHSAVTFPFSLSIYTFFFFRCGSDITSDRVWQWLSSYWNFPSHGYRPVWAVMRETSLITSGIIIWVCFRAWQQGWTSDSLLLTVPYLMWNGCLDLTDISSEIVAVITTISVCSSTQTTELFGIDFCAWVRGLELYPLCSGTGCPLQTTSQSHWPTFLWYWTIELVKISGDRIHQIIILSLILHYQGCSS